MNRSTNTPMWMRIPVVRGWLHRLRIWRSRRRLLSAYRVFSGSVAQSTIKEIAFNKEGCVFTLHDGRRYRFDPSRAAGWLYSVPFSGVFEQKETEYLKTLIRPGWVCLDVGACFGWYTVLLSHLAGRVGRVHAFEPVTPNLECLRANVALNGSGNVVLNDIALGEQAGKIKLYLPRHGVSASIRAHGSAASCKVLDATVSTLDDYVARNNLERLDFIKADIEGAELLLLNGGLTTLKRFKPCLMLEIQAHSTGLFGYAPAAVFTLLGGLGYRAYYVGKDAGLVPYQPSNAAVLPDYNFIFRHPETT